MTVEVIAAHSPELLPAAFRDMEEPAKDLSTVIQKVNSLIHQRAIRYGVGNELVSDFLLLGFYNPYITTHLTLISVTYSDIEHDQLFLNLPELSIRVGRV